MTHLTDFNRFGKLTGSQCAASVGLCKFTSRAKLWRQITGKEAKFEGNAFTQYGNDNEKHALSAFEAITGSLLDKGRFLTHPTIKWLGASPDGFVDDIIVEVKCPQTLHVECPLHYRIQMYAQMACAECISGWFFSWTPQGNYIEKVYFEPEYWNDYLLIGMDKFWNHYVAKDIEPPRGKFNIEKEIK